jgi:outer membrane receptor protein involved in Fe transport
MYKNLLKSSLLLTPTTLPLLGLLLAQLPGQVSYAATTTESLATELEAVEIIGESYTTLGPGEGLRLTKEQLPGNVQTITSEDIKAAMASSMGELVNAQLQSVNVNDYQGNPFQMDISYRGFSASPQLGTPQGLSVFLDGVRVNEPFGDIVNWDLIPMNALAGMDVFPGSNPLFGLNTLGGALALRSKNGFDDAGVNVSMQGGSWERKKGELSAGWNNGILGGFIAFTGFDEAGWRINSPSQVNQGFARMDWHSERFTLQASSLVVSNQLLGNGLIPTTLYTQNPAAVFSSPDRTDNDLQHIHVGGEFFFNDSLSVTGKLYHRTSNRHTIAGDIYEDFQDLDSSWSNPLVAQGTRTGQAVCRYQDANSDGIPDYGLDANSDGVIDSGSINTPLTASNQDAIALVPPMEAECDQINYVPVNKSAGARNGAAGDPSNQASGAAARGWIEGTPIGVLSTTAIEQLSNGASMQLNWTSDQHKFMLGSSVDSSDADFDTGQRLGLMDASHRVYLDPNAVSPVFVAGQEAIHNNSFVGKSSTIAGYVSETFSPKDNLHVNVSGRLNHTEVNNQLKARTRAGVDSLHDILDLNRYRPTVTVCQGTDPASCGTSPNYNLRANWDKDVLLSQDPYYGLGSYSETPTAERFTYNSFNPSFGLSYLPFKNTHMAAKDLNGFFNWSQGTRTPSSVELGCAYDGTLVPQTAGDPNSPNVPKSLASIGGACTLPTSLSGDPFLPQIFANSFEVGMRGTLFSEWQWNTSVYRTDLQDDIYLVGITASRSFFDTIGDTRRQGLELGFSGHVGQFDLQVNYGLTEATFQSNLFMLSPHNSSAAISTPLEPQYDSSGRPLEVITDMIHIQPDDRMPGIPLHNVNVGITLHATQKWEVAVSMVAHSSSFVRGNENNEHSQGAYEYIERPNSTGTGQELLRLRQFTDAGSVSGYVVFNLKSRYQLSKDFSVFGMVNNVFDSQYATAGRLGINPFSPSEKGAIGSSGWNYNSNDWLNSTLIGPGAPRAFWVGLDYHFE